MSVLEAVVLGIVQGLTEFLPISSTAHLRIVPAFVGWDDPGAVFTAVIQLGTMAAVLLYFWADSVRNLRAPGARACAIRRARAELDARMGWYLILGTIPIGALRARVQGPDRDRRPQPGPDRLVAHRVRRSSWRWPTGSGRRKRGIESLDRTTAS